MATVLEIAQRVAAATGLSGVAALYGSLQNDETYLANLANECALRIAKDHDWQKLARIHTITGDGSTVSFDLPSDFDFLPADHEIWSSRLESPLRHIQDRTDWLGLEVRQFNLTYNAWIIYGDQLHFKPAPETGEEIQFFYQSNLICQSTSGTNKIAFDADDDVFRLGDDLLELCMMWQHRERYGLPYGEDMNNYMERLALRKMRDGGPKELRLGSRRLNRDARLAYPRSIDVP